MNRDAFAWTEAERKGERRRRRRGKAIAKRLSRFDALLRELLDAGVPHAEASRRVAIAARRHKHRRT